MKGFMLASAKNRLFEKSRTQFIYLVELIRRYDVADEQGTVAGRPTRNRIHGEIVCDPSWSEARMLGGWFEGYMFLPEQMGERLHRPGSLADRFDHEMRSIPLEFEKGQPGITSWSAREQGVQDGQI